MLSIFENGLQPPQKKSSFLGTAGKIGLGLTGAGLATYGGYQLGLGNDGNWSFGNALDKTTQGVSNAWNWAFGGNGTGNPTPNEAPTTPEQKQSADDTNGGGGNPKV